MPRSFQVTAQLRELGQIPIGSFSCASVHASGPRQQFEKTLRQLCSPLKDPNQHILDSVRYQVGFMNRHCIDRSRRWWTGLAAAAPHPTPPHPTRAPPHPTSSVRLAQRRRGENTMVWKHSKRQIKVSRAGRAFRGRTSIPPTTLHPLRLSALLPTATCADVLEK